MQLSVAKNIIEKSIHSQIDLAKGCDSSRVIPYLVSEPGLGKTSIVKTVARENNMSCRVLTLAQYDAGEIAGWLIVDGKKMNRAIPDWMPQGNTGILFLDELPQAPVSNMNISAQIINERRVGRHRLPEKWAVVCAGNKLSNRAGTNAMPTHVRDRLMFLNIEADLEEFIEYGIGKDFKPLVLSFLRFRPVHLQKFDRNADACPSPRSWERVNTLLRLALDPIEMQESISGTVGKEACADLYGYMDIFDSCPDIRELIKNPQTADIPDDPAVSYAICANLSYSMNNSNGKNIITYLNRLPNKEYVAFVIKDAITREPKLKSAPFMMPVFRDKGAMKELALDFE